SSYKARSSSRPKRRRSWRHGFLQYRLPFSTVTVETPAQGSKRWLSIRSTPTSFIQEAQAGLPIRPTAVSLGGICPTRGLRRVSVPSLLILVIGITFMSVPGWILISVSVFTARSTKGRHGLILARPNLGERLSERSQSVLGAAAGC